MKFLGTKLEWVSGKKVGEDPQTIYVLRNKQYVPLIKVHRTMSALESEANLNLVGNSLKLLKNLEEELLWMEANGFRNTHRYKEKEKLYSQIIKV